MFTKKEYRIIIITALFTLILIAILDKLFLARNNNDNSIQYNHPSRENIQLSIKSTTPTTVLQQHSSIPHQKTSFSTANNANISFQSLIPKNSQCSKQITASYVKSTTNNNINMNWCKQKQSINKVSIGRSWGSLSKSDKQLWDKYKCNELLTIGKLQSCDQRWGWSYFNEWRNNAVNVVHGSLSNVTCMRDIKTSTFCQYNNILVDFSRVHTLSTSRSFKEGFFTVYGTLHNYAYTQNIPGFLVQEDKHDLGTMHSSCDIIETRPTLLLSNDDIYNLGHYYNDLIGIWGMLTIANIESKNAVLLNMDGFRKNGPAGVGSHRIMLPGQPDEHGPYGQYYQSWFQEVQKASDFGTKRVCYKELYLPPTPGIPWFWNEWSAINECSLLAPSPLYQSFNLFMRYHWNNAYSSSNSDNSDTTQKGLIPTSTNTDTSSTSMHSTSNSNSGSILHNPPTDTIHIVIEVRSINPKKNNNHSSGRHISNLNALITALKTIPGVKITAQDFAKISFNQQIQLAHTASILISMHGAGTTHIFHMAVGQPNCCALIELFPDPSIELYAAQGYGNLARQLGFYHYRNVADMGKTRAQGTEVDVTAIHKLAIEAVHTVRTKPTCLHNIRDTTIPVV